MKLERLSLNINNRIRLVRGNWRRRLRAALIPYAFILPMLLITCAFSIWPLLRTFQMSLQRWIITLGREPEWTGLDNYTAIARDPYFWNAFRQTLLYTLGTVPASLALGLLLAVLLNQRVPLRGVLRGVFFFPTVASTVVMAITWKYLFSVNGGVLPYLFSRLGLVYKDWLTDLKLALPAVMIASVWGSLGFIMVIFLSALQGIPKPILEAAYVDGAGKYRAFWRITFPLLQPAILFASVISMINGFKVFEQVYVMTEGGPGYATTTIVQYIYEQGFEFFNMGIATAASVILFLMLLVFTWTQIKFQGGERS